MSTKRLTSAQNGQVLVIAALFLFVLVMCCGLGIDGGRLYDRSAHLQRAADEAALSAAIAQGEGNDPYGAGATTINRNLGIRSSIGKPEIISSTTILSTDPVRAQVIITDTSYPLIFGSLFGHGNAAIQRLAIGNYDPLVQMSNPTNTLGREGSAIPDPSGGTHPQNMELAVNGPDTFAESGDPYSPPYLLPTNANSAYPALTNPYRVQANGQHFAGYDYKIAIPPASAAAPNDLTYIQVLDPGTCYTNDDANGGVLGDHQINGHYGLPFSDPMETTADNDPSHNRTYFSVFAAGTGTEYALADPASPVYSALVWHAQQDTADAGEGSAFGALPPSNPESAIEMAPGINELCTDAAEHVWHTLAVVKPVPNKESSYIVNVNTCLDDTNPNDFVLDGGTPLADPDTGAKYALCRGGQVNMFALRAVTSSDLCTGTGCPSSTTDASDTNLSPTEDDTVTQPTVSGDGRLSIYARGAGQEVNGVYTARLALANIGQAYEGKWLKIRLFDPGDLSLINSNGPGTGVGTIEIVRPDNTFAPLEWDTETLATSDPADTSPDSLTPFTTTMVNNGSTALVTSFPTKYGYPIPTTCPSGDSVPQILSGTHSFQAYGQTPTEMNPFDPTFHAIGGTPPTQPGCTSGEFDPTAAPGPVAWDQQPYARDAKSGSSPSTYNVNVNYAYYNGRWVDIYTQVPTTYTSTNGSYYWYVEYDSDVPPTDRTTWEVSILNNPPNLVQ